MSLRVENSFRDLDERYRVLVVYNLCVSDMLFYVRPEYFSLKTTKGIAKQYEKKNI